ncbi:MFS family transporter: sugar [Micractinium conductrix]|uniref:MFS family transporter: sugar n=1 Tax=Micractinium conductrix TaxID=554055 RepID=A0A2P6VRC8_9CHLO|nr:MFS family transporter: sugar [Micractinium conductrix]|eukprot:PSC76649.1 MFS family transporter: sugar [Micractinium conductrix]
MPSPRFVDRGAALGETTAGLQLHSGAGDHRGAAAGGTQQPALPGAPLLPPAAASAGRRSDSPWHALEIQSSEDGSGHVHHAKLEAAVLTAAALHTTDPTERLLPGAPSERRPSTPVLPGGISKRERMVMVSLFSLTAALLYADQNLMAPNLTAIATDFGFDEAQRDRMLGGVIAAAFYLVGAPAALLFGWLSDHVNRKRLLFAAVVLGEGPCMLTIFVTNYWQLFTLRLLTGIALGGALPVVFSLLGDLYDPSLRAGVSSIVQLSTGVGLAVGQGIAGFAGPAIGWRWPFFIVSVPAMIVACVMLLVCKEPKRGGTEAALQEQFQEHSLFEYTERMTWRKLGRLLLIPTNIFVILQGLFGCVPWGMILTYLNDYLSQNKGMSVQGATLVLLVLGIGGAIGVVGGGIVGQWLYNRRKWAMSVFIGTCTVAGVLPMYFLINADVKNVLPLTIIAALLAGGLSGTVGPNMRAMIINCNEPETRGMALAIQSMLDDLGKGLGPVFVSFFIQKLGRSGAFNLSTAGWIPCGLLLLGTAFTLARDEDAMQHRLRKVLSSYTFSSSTLNQLDEDEDGEVAEHEYTQRPLAAAATAADAFPSQHEQQQLGVVQLPLTAVEAALAKPLGDGRDDGGSVAGRPAPP